MSKGHLVTEAEYLPLLTDAASAAVDTAREELALAELRLLKAEADLKKQRHSRLKLIEALVASRGSLGQALTVLKSRHKRYPTAYSDMAIKSATFTLVKIKDTLLT
jgi:hypothetical protein